MRVGGGKDATMVPEELSENDRLREFVADLAGRIGLDADRRQALDIAASLLGVGRLPVVDILSKKGTLAPEEVARIRDIPRIWADFAGQLAPLRDLGVPDILEAYCESWDGTGYPKELVGEAIPLGARLLAVCYNYNGRVSDRPYRRALPHGDAAAALRGMSGRMLDPALVETFIEMVEEKRKTVRMIAKPRAQKRAPAKKAHGKRPARKKAGAVKKVKKRAAKKPKKKAKKRAAKKAAKKKR